MEKITKEEIYELAKKNGFTKEEGEAMLVLLSKKAGNFTLDVLGLVAEKTENKIDDMVYAAGRPTLAGMIDDIEIAL